MLQMQGPTWQHMHPFMLPAAPCGRAALAASERRSVGAVGWFGTKKPAPCLRTVSFTGTGIKISLQLPNINNYTICATMINFTAVLELYGFCIARDAFVCQSLTVWRARSPVWRAFPLGCNLVLTNTKQANKIARATYPHGKCIM